jgi:superoxide dismutase, Cu-Zn family
MKNVLLPALLPPLLLAALASCYGQAKAGEPHEGPQRAEVTLVPVGDSGVSGHVLFTRTATGIRVTGEIKGLTPGEHGFHVHEYGDVSDTAAGKSAGGHFAPRGMPHGAPQDAKRHVGDLGNIVADKDGVARIDITDSVIALEGEDSILGRALVVHAGKDHFTQPSGDAGARVAFGVIGVAGPGA